MDPQVQSTRVEGGRTEILVELEEFFHIDTISFVDHVPFLISQVDILKMVDFSCADQDPRSRKHLLICIKLVKPFLTGETQQNSTLESAPNDDSLFLAIALPAVFAWVPALTLKHTCSYSRVRAYLQQHALKAGLQVHIQARILKKVRQVHYGNQNYLTMKSDFCNFCNVCEISRIAEKIGWVFHSVPSDKDWVL